MKMQSSKTPKKKKEEASPSRASKDVAASQSEAGSMAKRPCIPDMNSAHETRQLAEALAMLSKA